jgi:hypothetical protein
MGASIARSTLASASRSLKTAARQAGERTDRASTASSPGAAGDARNVARVRRGERRALYLTMELIEGASPSYCTHARPALREAIEAASRSPTAWPPRTGPEWCTAIRRPA